MRDEDGPSGDLEADDGRLRFRRQRRELYFLFAVAVVFSHAFVLGGFDETARYAWSNNSLSFGTLGVSGFFVLGAVVCLTGSVAGFPVTGDAGALGFVTENSTVLLRQWSIGRTLEGAPFPVSWNGALWRMASLFTGHLVLAGLLGLGVLAGRRWLAPAATGVFWLITAAESSSLVDVDLRSFHGVTQGWQATLLGPDSTQLISLFFLGSAAYLYRDQLPTGPVAVLVALSVLEASFVLQQWQLFGGPAWAYLTLVLLIRLPWRLGGPLGVVSFGIYMWAFPVEQLGALLGLHGWGYRPYATICLAVACLAALTSYSLVEQPTTRLRGRLMRRPVLDPPRTQPTER